MGWQDDPIVDEQQGASSQPWMNDPIADSPGPQAPMPTMGEVALNAVPKGIASVINTPNVINHLILKGVASLPGMDAIPGVKKFLEEGAEKFAHNAPEHLMEMAGIVDPAKNPQTGPQRLVDSAIRSAVGAAIAPGAGLAGAGQGAAMGALGGIAAQGTKEFTGSDLLAGIAGVITPFAAGAAMNALGTSGKKLLIGDQAKMTLQDARKEGYVVEPSQIRQPSSKLESIAGKAAIPQEASLRNQQVTNSLAARALGLPGDTPLSMGVIEAVRERAAEPYAELAKLIPKGQLQGMKVTSSVDREMLPGPATGLRVTHEQGMLPGPVTGLNVKEVSGAPVATGLRMQEVRDAAGRLIGMRGVQTSEGTKGALENIQGKVTSRGSDVPGPIEGIKTTVTSRGQDVPGPIQGMRVKVEQTRSEPPIEELKQARADANAFYRHYDRSADPASLKAAKAANARAKELENQIESIATQMGRPDLVQKMRSARQLIARTYDIERALNLANGDVSASIIGRSFDKGAPLTGELGTIARFAQAFPRVSRDASSLPPAGVSGTDAGMSALLATAGAAGSGSMYGVLAGGLPLLRGPAREYLLSKKYQDSLLDIAPRLNLHVQKYVPRLAAGSTLNTVMNNREKD